MKLGRILMALALPAALLVLSACGGAANANNSSAKSGMVGASGASQSIQLEVLNGELATKYGILGPDGRGHDSFVPAHLTLKAGVPITFTVVNYDEGPHTFTIPELNLNATIAARVNDNTPSTSTFTVTFPKAGDYRWYCALPCDGGQGGWAMTSDRAGAGPDQNAAMAGYVTAV
jgi:membrane fusion protein, multidrug efflux system